MVLHYRNNRVIVHHGDCLDVMRGMAAKTVDAIITDPPYGLGFMGKEWDDLPPGLPWAQQCFRVLKPGGHLLSFGGTRTWHRLAVAIEDAGFEIRDSIAWLYGSGFPKSQDVSKAIDKLDATEERRCRALEFAAWFRSTGITRQKAAEVSGLTSVTNHYFEVTAQPAIATADIFDKLRPYLPEVPARIEELVRQRTVESQNYAARAVVGRRIDGAGNGSVVGLGSARVMATEFDETAAHTPTAQQWAGWGTALKPAFEPIVVARKPLQGTIAANVLAHGTGALNIDGTRVQGEPVAAHRQTEGPKVALGTGWGDGYQRGDAAATPPNTAGRWPTNVALDDTTATELDATGPHTKSAVGPTVYAQRLGGEAMTAPRATAPDLGHREVEIEGYADSGGPSRFFPVFKYQAKAPDEERATINHVTHPTVKPLALMRWLVRLVTPPGGIVLDPFAGTGATLEACLLEGARCITIEQQSEYLPHIKVRINRYLNATRKGKTP